MKYDIVDVEDNIRHYRYPLSIRIGKFYNKAFVDNAVFAEDCILSVPLHFHTFPSEEVLDDIFEENRENVVLRSRHGDHCKYGVVSFESKRSRDL